MKTRALPLMFITLGLLATSCSANPNDANANREPSEFVAASGAKLSNKDIDTFVKEQMEKHGLPGLTISIFDKGNIVYSQSLGIANIDTNAPVTDASVFEFASLSKPVFSYFVLRLVDKGILDLDRPLYKYLPMEKMEQYPEYRKITARMALSHRTGFPNWRWFDPAPPELGISRGTMYMKGPPGAFSYSGEGYNYLAQVVAHLTNNDLTTLDSLFQEEVVKPLSLKHMSYVRTAYVSEHKVSGHRDGEVYEKEWPRSFPDDTPQTFGAAGRLHTSASTYAKFLLALIDGKGLSKPSRSAYFEKHTNVPITSDDYKLNGITGWGLGIAIEETPYGRRYEHGGNNGDFQSGMMVFPDRQMGYVFATNSDNGADFNKEIQKFLTKGLVEAAK